MADEESQRPNAGGGRGGTYKLWAFIAIISLASCSMLTASITLKWSPLDLKQQKDFLDADLDLLDLEERVKMVMQMWDTYQQHAATTARLSSFWREAFGAAYQQLASDVSAVRDAAFVEIAQMSFRFRDIRPPRSTSSSMGELLQGGVQMPLKKNRKGGGM